VSGNRVLLAQSWLIVEFWFHHVMLGFVGRSWVCLALGRGFGLRIRADMTFFLGQVPVVINAE
jgi:hypothetical protein